MGMFDTIYINSKLLPVTVNEKKLLENSEYQTKDFDNVLDTFYITDDFFILKQYSEYVSVPPEERPYPDPNHRMHFCGSFRKVDLYKQIYDFTGDLKFYTSVNSKWYEFIADVKNGYIKNITGGFTNLNQKDLERIRKEKIKKIFE